MKRRQIICACCGHTEQAADLVVDHVSYPDRYVYVGPQDRTKKLVPWRCPQCGEDKDAILFGRNVILNRLAQRHRYGLPQLDLESLPHVRASNAAWETMCGALAGQETQRLVAVSAVSLPG